MLPVPLQPSLFFFTFGIYWSCKSVSWWAEKLGPKPKARALARRTRTMIDEPGHVILEDRRRRRRVSGRAAVLAEDTDAMKCSVEARC